MQDNEVVFTLRSWATSDQDVIVEALGNRRVARNLFAEPYPYTSDAAQRFIEKAIDETSGVVQRAIIVDNDAVGGLGYRLQNAQAMNRVFADTSYYIALYNPKDPWNAAAPTAGNEFCPLVLPSLRASGFYNNLSRPAKGKPSWHVQKSGFGY
jgi:hypothetical protein